MSVICYVWLRHNRKMHPHRLVMPVDLVRVQSRRLQSGWKKDVMRTVMMQVCIVIVRPYEVREHSRLRRLASSRVRFPCVGSVVLPMTALFWACRTDASYLKAVFLP